MIDSNKIVSSHIFVFPFRWDYVSNKNCLNSTIDKRVNVQKIIQILDDKKWVEDKLEILNDVEYNKYAYFYDNVRQAIYGKEKVEDVNKEVDFNIFKSNYYIGKSTKQINNNRVVYCFRYNDLNEQSKYNITVEKQGNTNIYSLKIKDIKLKIYDTGVANLTYFLENYDENLTEEDILKINDYGRRIYPQFLPLEICQNNFLSKKLSLQLPSGTIEENFIYETKKEPTRISETIMRLLGDNFKCNKKDINKENVYITPIIDDRMFTLCIYRNNDIARKLTKFTEKEYLENNFWYKYVFIDNGSSTCQDEDMFKELLKKSTYTRWKKYGTLYGISRYSFVCIVDKGDFGLTIRTQMQTMYYEMVTLALTQRASILRFSDEASKIATLDEKEALINVKKLQRYYIEFVNDIYFREVTAQEQGIEMYNKLIQMMNIERDVKRLDEEIDKIYKYTSLISDEKTNNLLNLITQVGLVISILGVVTAAYAYKTKQILVWMVIWAFVAYAFIHVITKFKLK